MPSPGRRGAIKRRELHLPSPRGEKRSTRHHSGSGGDRAVRPGTGTPARPERARPLPPAESHRPSLLGGSSTGTGHATPPRARRRPCREARRRAPATPRERQAQSPESPPTRLASRRPEEAAPARHTHPAPAATVPPGREREANSAGRTPHQRRQPPHRTGKSQRPEVETGGARPTPNVRPPPTPTATPTLPRRRPCRQAGRRNPANAPAPSTPAPPPDANPKNHHTPQTPTSTPPSAKNPPPKPAPKTKTMRRPPPRRKKPGVQRGGLSG